jgi:hypothetical protein
MRRRKNDPPSWFKPVIAGLALLAVAILALILTFGLMDAGDEAISIAGRTYSIPADHIASGPAADVNVVRFRKPGAAFEIAYDRDAEGKHDPAGVPFIVSINDAGQRNIAYDRARHTLVVCQRREDPSAECGTWIRDGDASWSVLFTRGRMREADAIVAEAKEQLKSYRRASHRHLVPS